MHCGRRPITTYYANSSIERTHNGGHVCSLCNSQRRRCMPLTPGVEALEKPISRRAEAPLQDFRSVVFVRFPGTLFEERQILVQACRLGSCGSSYIAVVGQLLDVMHQGSIASPPQSVQRTATLPYLFSLCLAVRTSRFDAVCVERQ